MKIDFLARGFAPEGTFIIGAFEGKKLEGIAADVDKKIGGALARAMASKNFKGKKDEAIRLTAPSGLPVTEIILFGLGKDITPLALEELGATVMGVLEKCRDK